MLAAEPELHAMFSVVPAFVRAAGVEAAAAAKGLHIFSEKPQTLDMATARGIAAAIEQAGVVSSVGFRERYRPLFRAARDYLADKEVVHVSFRSFSGVPKPKPAEIQSWHDDFSKMGGTMFDWGCHAVDYVRFMTGEDIASAQAWYNHPERYLTPLSASVNFLLTNGATMTSTFVSAGQFDREPWFVIHFVGGTLALYGYDRMEVDTGDGPIVEYSAAKDFNTEAPSDGYVRGVGYDPWCAPLKTHPCLFLSVSTFCTSSWCHAKGVTAGIFCIGTGTNRIVVLWRMFGTRSSQHQVVAHLLAMAPRCDW
jgi:predicted dehydrogenase